MLSGLQDMVPVQRGPPDQELVRGIVLDPEIGAIRALQCVLELRIGRPLGVGIGL